MRDRPHDCYRRRHRGGTSLVGDKGTVVGAPMGSLLTGRLNNAVILANLSVSQQMIIRGLIILIAASFSLREGATDHRRDQCF
jgi:ribose transport system permease protein